MEIKEEPQEPTPTKEEPTANVIHNPEEFLDYLNAFEANLNRESVWNELEMLPSHREGPGSEREVNQFLGLPHTSSRNQKAQTLPQKIIKKTKDLIKRPRKASPVHLPSELIIKPVL